MQTKSPVFLIRTSERNNMRKVALISPQGDIFGKNKRMKDFVTGSQNMASFRYLWTGPNLGLLTIASLLPEDWEYYYYDENYKEIDFTISFDYVFISAMTQQVVKAYHIADRMRRLGSLVIMGGIHVTIMPKEASQHADVVLAGEGEVLIPQFLSDLRQGTIKKIYEEKNKGEYDLSKSKMPKYELLEGYNYPLITLQTTRGCPRDCSFCSASKIFGPKYRRKSNRQIILELERIKALYPDALVLFADDNMFNLRNQAKELLTAMQDMGIRWIAQTDISVAEDAQLLEKMVLAGCQWIVIGFESISSASLQDIDQTNWKLKQFPKYESAIRIIQSYGIGIYGTFIVGLDEDHKDVFQNTAEFIEKNGLYGCNITVPTPLPGTRLRANLLEKDRVLEKDWSYYTFWDVNIVPQNLTTEELEDGLLYLYQQVSSPEMAVKRLINLRKLEKNRRSVVIRGIHV